MERIDNLKKASKKVFSEGKDGEIIKLLNKTLKNKDKDNKGKVFDEVNDDLKVDIDDCLVLDDLFGFGLGTVFDNRSKDAYSANFIKHINDMKEML